MDFNLNLPGLAQDVYALSCPSIDPKSFWINCFGWVQIFLVRSKLFWSGPNHFGQVQIILFWTNFYDLDLSKSKVIWSRPKRRPNHFGPIEGQGINIIDIFFSGQARILEDQFELLMDRLEKESYFHVQTNGKDYR